MVLCIQRWISGILHSIWDWINAEPSPVSHAPHPAGRMEVVFSLSVFVFAITGLSAIVSRAAGDQLIVVAFAIAAGAFGACTSMLGSTRSRPMRSARGDIPFQPAWSSIMLKMVVGSGAAYVLYLLAKLGIVAGGPFPDLNYLADHGAGSASLVRTLSVADFGKLMAGCFLAGFAERWVGSTRPKSGDRS